MEERSCKEKEDQNVPGEEPIWVSGWRDSSEIATGHRLTGIYLCTEQRVQEFITDFKFQTRSWLLISYLSVLIIRLSEQEKFPVPNSLVPTKSPLTQSDVASDRGDKQLLGIFVVRMDALQIGCLWKDRILHIYGEGHPSTVKVRVVEEYETCFSIRHLILIPRYSSVPRQSNHPCLFYAKFSKDTSNLKMLKKNI